MEEIHATLYYTESSVGKMICPRRY